VSKLALRPFLRMVASHFDDGLVCTVTNGKDHILTMAPDWALNVARRRLLAVELWEISIVTFPLLAGARVRAMKQASSPPRASSLRTRAEREWARVVTGAGVVLPADVHYRG
jgi:hypothetical protein